MQIDKQAHSFFLSLTGTFCGFFTIIEELDIDIYPAEMHSYIKAKNILR